MNRPNDLQRHILGLWLDDNRHRYQALPEKISARAVERVAKVYGKLRPEGPSLPATLVQDATSGLRDRLLNRDGGPKNPVDFWRELTSSQAEAIEAKLGILTVRDFQAAKEDALLIVRNQASNAFAERTLRELVRELEPEKKNPDDLHLLLESLGVGNTAAQTELLTVSSNLAYQALRDVVAKQQFREIPDSPWPTAFLQKDGAVGIAQLRPIEADEPFPIEPERKQRLIELMWSQRAELSDLDADVLDMLSAIWLRQARTPNDPAVATVDDCLRMRGLTPKLGGTGRRGGFSAKQREEFLYALGRIESTWLKMSEVESYTGPKGRPQTTAIESRAFVMTTRLGQMRLDGRMDIQQFIFRPGDIFSRFLFGPGRQTALLSAKAVQYDYYRHKWEKRLTRYLSWLWRINATNTSISFPLKVGTLLDCVGEAEKSPRFPNRVRERLEKALDTLKEDAVISSWQYSKQFSETAIEQQQNWYPMWLRWTVDIEPPPEILDHYRNLIAAGSGAGNSGGGGGTNNSAGIGGGAGRARSRGQRIRARREELGLSQSAAAAQIGIDRTLLSRIEQDKRNPSQNDLTKIERWLESAGGLGSMEKEQLKADHA